MTRMTVFAFFIFLSAHAQNPYEGPNTPQDPDLPPGAERRPYNTIKLKNKVPTTPVLEEEQRRDLPPTGSPKLREDDALPKGDDALPKRDDALPKRDDALPKRDDLPPTVRVGEPKVRNQNPLPSSEERPWSPVPPRDYALPTLPPQALPLPADAAPIKIDLSKEVIPTWVTRKLASMGSVEVVGTYKSGERITGLKLKTSDRSFTLPLYDNVPVAELALSDPEKAYLMLRGITHLSDIPDNGRPNPKLNFTDGARGLNELPSEYMEFFVIGKGDTKKGQDQFFARNVGARVRGVAWNKETQGYDAIIHYYNGKKDNAPDDEVGRVPLSGSGPAPEKPVKRGIAVPFSGQTGSETQSSNDNCPRLPDPLPLTPRVRDMATGISNQQLEKIPSFFKLDERAYTTVLDRPVMVTSTSGSCRVNLLIKPDAEKSERFLSRVQEVDWRYRKDRSDEREHHTLALNDNGQIFISDGRKYTPHSAGPYAYVDEDDKDESKGFYDTKTVRDPPTTDKRGVITYGYHTELFYNGKYVKDKPKDKPMVLPQRNFIPLSYFGHNPKPPVRFKYVGVYAKGPYNKGTFAGAIYALDSEGKPHVIVDQGRAENRENTKVARGTFNDYPLDLIDENGAPISGFDTMGTTSEGEPFFTKDGLYYSMIVNSDKKIVAKKLRGKPDTSDCYTGP